MRPVNNRRCMRGPFLVTGATGFIGSNLVRRLVALGEQVHVILRPKSSKWRISDVSVHLKEHYADLRDEPRLREIVKLVKPKIVFHCAAYGNLYSQTDVNEIYCTNVLGTISLIRAISIVEYDVFINTGSFFEYGNKSTAAGEDATPEPLNAYAAAKLAATLYCQMVARSEGYEVVTLRLFYPYGPFEAPDRLIPSVVRACIEHRELRLTAGDQTRDFVFVGDVVNAYLRAAQVKGLAGHIFNIGSGTGYTVKEVVEQVVYLLGNTTVPLWGKLPMRRFDIMRCDADITRAQQVLGWIPGVRLSDGLMQTIGWHRSTTIKK